MEKKNIIEAMIPFITNMMSGKREEDEGPLVFEINNCLNFLEDDTHIFFAFTGEGISERLEALNPTAEFWAYGEDADVLVGTLPLTVKYLDATYFEDGGRFALVSELLEESGPYNSANYAKIFIGDYTKNLEITLVD